MEFASSVWNPPAQSKPHEKITPSALRKKTQIIGLTDLKTRRERGDFIHIYKIVHGLERVKWYDEYKILRPEQNITA